MKVHPERHVAQHLQDLYRRNGWWRDVTFSEILQRRVEETPDRIAFKDDRRSVTYKQLLSEVRRFAELLRREGVGRGDVVTLQVPNRVEFPVVFFALELIGAIANKISPDLRAEELRYILDFSGSKAYVCALQFKGFSYVDMFRDVRSRLSTPVLAVCVDPVAGDDVVSFPLTLSALPEISDEHRVYMDPDEIMRMCFTSGTTGNPKGVLHSFNTTLCAAAFLNRDMRVTEDDVLLAYLPVALNWGYLTLLQSVMAGARTVLLERFSARAALECIASERVTFIPTAPAAIVALLNAPELSSTDCSSLRVMVTGGASASIETIRRFGSAFPQARLIELYGMLETGFHSYTRLEDDPLDVIGTVGRCVEELELGIFDDAGHPVEDGQTGELCAKGPSVHLGYLNNAQANRESFTGEGWFKTGDLGEIADKNRNIRISGRKKEIINRGGKKYFPREIEDLLYEHEAFLQLAVVGVPDARLGERNCLFAVLKPGAQITLDAIIAMLKGRVADYKLPEDLIILDGFPMTPTGKIRRAELLKKISACTG
ncbi:MULTISPECIES: class I adenylate-forming enzyme family protein [unclassified Caballeronia]|uniref:class I adenylate-forming enzyme family protein n=1 Tax=unclassified Caballeronia TaxID=2646786 RepID=UPI0020285644|nr:MULTISPECIES: class I adenylate-forming enzyme family protein [unclassified Caballeronia]